MPSKTTSRKGETIDLWYSGKKHDFGGNVQAVMRPDGFPVWVGDVEPGSAHDLTFAQEHALGALYAFASRGLPTLADPGYEGAGHGVYTPFKQPPDGRRLDIDNRTYSMLLRSLRGIGERGFALLVERRRVLQHVTACPARSANSRKPPWCSPISSTDIYLGEITSLHTHVKVAEKPHCAPGLPR